MQQPFEWAYQGMKLMAAYLKGDKSGIPANGADHHPDQDHRQGRRRRLRRQSEGDVRKLSDKQLRRLRVRLEPAFVLTGLAKARQSAEAPAHRLLSGMMNYSDTSIVASTIAPFLSLENVRKTYPGVVALDGFSMEVRPGEVIGLVGENGAGKSTLMKILGGVTTPDTGTITVDGVAHDGLTVEGSLGSGIAFVHQELNLFENLDVAANIFFGREPLRAGPLKLVDRAKLRAMVAPLLKRVGANFSADTPVAALSLAQQQMVEIAKALSIKARLVILDEPTSSLPLAETDKLLDVIKALKADGISVIFISHRLHEVERVADRVVVLRDGMLAGTLPKSDINHDQMVKLMIGRMLKEREKAAEVGAGARRRRAVGQGHPHPRLSRPAGRSRRQARRNPRPCRACRLRPHRAGAGAFRHRQQLWRHARSSTASRWFSARPPMPSRTASFSCPRTAS